MKAKTLASKVLKKYYGKFPLSHKTCKCFEVCIETLGQMIYEEAQKHQWRYDIHSKHAVDVQLYNIGERCLKKREGKVSR